LSDDIPVEFESLGDAAGDGSKIFESAGDSSAVRMVVGRLDIADMMMYR